MQPIGGNHIKFDERERDNFGVDSLVTMDSAHETMTEFRAAVQVIRDRVATLDPTNPANTDVIVSLTNRALDLETFSHGIFTILATEATNRYFEEAARAS